MIDPDKLINAAIAGGISFTGQVVAVATVLPEGATLAAIGGVTWLVIAATGIGNFLKDWKTRRGA